MPRGRYRLRNSGSKWPVEHGDKHYEGSETIGMVGHDSMTSEYSQDYMSVDDILAEYLGEQIEAPQLGEAVFQTPPPETVSGIAQMEAEARRIAADAARQRYYDGASEGASYEAFDGGQVSMEPEEDYQAPYAQPYSDPMDDYEDDYDEMPKKKAKRSLFGKKKKKSKKADEPEYPDYPDDEDDYAASFRDYNAGGDYAEDDDYEFDEKDKSNLTESVPPSFGDYLLSIVAGAFYKFRGGKGGGAQTMEDEDEELGAEVLPLQGSKYYGAHVHSLRLRLRIGAAIWAIMAYISFGFPIPGMIQYLPVATAFCVALQLTIMLLSLDVVTTAVLKVFRFRGGADSLAVFSCLLTTADAALVISDNTSPHMTLCLLSSLSLLGILAASFLSARGLRKTLRVPAIGKRVYSVTGEVNVKGSDITLLKSVRPPKGFVRRAEEEAPDESLFVKAAPFIVILTLLLSLLVCVIKADLYDIVFVASAIMAPAAPVMALIVFALPFCIGANRIFSSGAAIAGWSGLCDIGQSKNLIVTDRDIFPDGSVEIESIRIFADEDAETVMAFAGTMITASGSSISACFADMMEKNDCTMRQVIDFEYLSGGGMKGVIDGHIVLCGNTDLMRLMNVRIPFRLISKTCVLLAIDGLLYGIFGLKYTPLPLVRQALKELIHSNRHPVFAIRDFNVTPEMLHDCFDIATDGYDFPPYIERFTISEAKPSKDSKIAAVICREGLAALVNMADTGRSIYMATRINLLITVLSAVIGMLVVFMKLMVAGGVELNFLLVFMLVWAVPVLLLSFFMKT